jgi:hypothetical protein
MAWRVAIRVQAVAPDPEGVGGAVAEQGQQVAAGRVRGEGARDIGQGGVEKAG